MARFLQVLLIVSVLGLSWLWMQVAHELGHCLGAWATGATVQRVVLHPLAISRTDVIGGRSPLVVIWAGPLIGVLIPLATWGAVAAVGLRLTWLAKFFAGFCCLANGIYIGVGSFEGIGDAGDLLRHGSPIWTLWLFGILTAPAGISFWNHLGKYFAIGPTPVPAEPRLALALLIALVATIVAESALSHRF